MNGLAIRVIGGFVAVFIVYAAAQYVKELRADLATAQDDIQDAHQETLDRDETIRVLLEKHRKTEAARKKLAAEQTGIRSALATRENTIRSLQNENAELRAWSAVPLPGPIIRLHQHPEITGAADYRKRLPGGSTLQPADSVGGN